MTLLSVFSAATPVFAEEITEITSGSTENVDDMTVSSEETETEETEEVEIVSEIEDMRTEYTKYFRMSDGSYMAAQYAQPVHFKENGEWKEYDYSITKEESTNDFVIENSDNEMSFPEEFSEDNETQIEVSAREYDIKFSPVFDKKIFNNSEKQKGKVKDHKKLKSNEIIEEFTEEAPIDESADKNAKKLKIDNQKQLGADLLCDCVGAYNKYPGDLLVVDLGTATKLLAVNKNKEYLKEIQQDHKTSFWKYHQMP